MTASPSSPTTSVQLQTTDFSTTTASSSLAPPVVLVHGLLGNRKNFNSIGTALSQQLQTHRRILSVDLRNHGETVATEGMRETMSLEEMANDVVSVLDRHGIPKAVLVGHSIGGKVCQALSLLYPERVQGLVVLDIAPVAYTTREAHWQAIHEIIQACANIPPGVYTKKEVDAMLQQDVPDPALRAFLLTNYGEKEWKIPMECIRNQLDALAGFDIPSTCQYTGDVFIIHGGQSRFVRSGHMTAIQDYFPNHMLTTIRGAGHWVHAEAPDATIALLKRFLDR